MDFRARAKALCSVMPLLTPALKLGLGRTIVRAKAPCSVMPLVTPALKLGLNRTLYFFGFSHDVLN
jgi:hypothetical protein